MEWSLLLLGLSLAAQAWLTARAFYLVLQRVNPPRTRERED